MTSIWNSVDRHILFVLLSFLVMMRAKRASNPTTEIKDPLTSSSAHSSPTKEETTSDTPLSRVSNTSNASTSSITSTMDAPGGRQARVVTYTTAYSSYYSATTQSSSLSGGAIAGIVIAVLVLLCCCALGACAKSGHWEQRQVWVEH